MERWVMEVQSRRETGKGPARRIRREGRIPGVLYSPRVDPIPVSADPMEVKRVLSSGDNVLIDLRIRDGEQVRQYLAMVKDYQVHPVKDQLWHVDFYEISLQEEIEVEVPLAFVGKPIGVKMGGLLNPLLRSLEISCLPGQLPEHLKVDCSSLQIGESLHVSDLIIPDGVRVKTDPSTPVVTILAPEAEEAVGEEEAVEEESPTESEGSEDE